MLKLKNIQTFYGNIQALKGVTIEIAEGEIITLIGANGAGKNHNTHGCLRHSSSEIG